MFLPSVFEKPVKRHSALKPQTEKPQTYGSVSMENRLVADSFVLWEINKAIGFPGGFHVCTCKKEKKNEKVSHGVMKKIFGVKDAIILHRSEYICQWC